MRYLPILLLVFVGCEPVYAESIRWLQPDYEAGDTWEVRITAVEVAPGWQPLEELWHVGEVRGAVVSPIVSMTVEARTWRGGVVSEVSNPVVIVPEPGGLGLLAGLGVMWWMKRRERM